ncbi:hypothetical protein BJV78DRAFT_1168361 [Lactifluus subvellereus]|nr:hypothetical protein BJV78DRAFT_1168361 [Lactifluus subvellereus]
MAELLYVRRLYILSKRVIVPLAITGAASITFVCGFGYSFRAFALKRFSLYGSLTWVACLGLGTLFTADVLIALSMCWFLYQRRTGFVRTDSTIMTLMSYSISSGLLTSVIAAGTVTVYVIAPTSLLPEAFYWVLIKCHANALLAMLNSRELILERSANLHPENTFYMASFRTTQQKETDPESMSKPTTISVSAHQSTTTDCASCKYDLNTEPKLLNVEKSVRSCILIRSPHSYGHFY